MKEKQEQKRFLQWISVKERVHTRDSQPPYFHEGEMWWAYVGENVGSETNGKGKQFTRPVVIYRKLGAYTFLGIPTTTKQKEGTWFVPFRHKDIAEVAVLSQIRILSSKRLREKIGEIDESDMSRIRKGFRDLYL